MALGLSHLIWKSLCYSVLHGFANDLTGAGSTADGIHRRGLLLHHLTKNCFRRSTSSVFMFQKFNAFQPVIPDSDPNRCPDNASVTLTFIDAVFYLCQVDFIKGKRVHLHLIVTDGCEVSLLS